MKVNATRKNGHIYWEWNKNFSFNTFLSKPQLGRLHKHFLHPSTSKLYNLLRRAKIDFLSESTRDILDEISKSCDVCQKYSSKQISFRVDDKGDIKFNHRILLDLIYLDVGKGKQQPVQHVVDEGTRFQAAFFLPAHGTKTIWNTFLKIWSQMYVGFPESMLTDQGSVFYERRVEI